MCLLSRGANTSPPTTTDYVRTLPTIQHLRGQGAKTILCSHLGRPGGKVVDELRLWPVGDRLGVLLGSPVTSIDQCVGSGVSAAVNGMGPGDVLLLENLRFHAEEEANDPDFAKALGSVADLFVMDAFAVAHRAHASTVGVPRYLPSAAGMLLQREVEYLDRALASPEKPVGRVAGRGQGQRQDHPAGQPSRQGGPGLHRRGHGFHIPEGTRLRRWGLHGGG